MKTLRDVLPYEATNGEFEGSRFLKFLDVEVIENNASNTYKPWPGVHKHVYGWWKLANGYAVGCNENPSRGLSFPVAKIN